MQFFQRQLPGNDRERQALGIAQPGDPCLALKRQIDLRHGLMAVPINGAIFALKHGVLHGRPEGVPASLDAEMGQGESDGFAVELRKAPFAQGRSAVDTTVEYSEQTCIAHGELVPAQVRHIDHYCIAVLGDAVQIPLREQERRFFTQAAGFHPQRPVATRRRKAGCNPQGYLERPRPVSPKERERRGRGTLVTSRLNSISKW